MTTKTKTNAKGWPPERRAEQAARIRRQKPWEKATGPRTDPGKAAVRLNALKHGVRSAEMRALCRLLRRQRDFVKAVMVDGSSRHTGQNMLQRWP